MIAPRKVKFEAKKKENENIEFRTFLKCNADEKEFGDIVAFVKTLPNVKELHILPYHNFGEGKYNLLGRDYELSNVKKLDEDHINKLKEIVESSGLICKVGG